MTGTPSPGPDRPSIPDLQDACRSATTWLLRHLGPDGALGDPGDGFKYHRAPWAFALMGETAAGHAVCDFVRRRLVRDGVLNGPDRLLDDGWAYRDSSFVIGAHMLEQYDLSTALMPGMLAWQDEVSGGFANDRLADGSRSDEMDVPYACGPGFACLATGRLGPAREVARFLATVEAAQPDLPDRFHLFWSRSRQRLIMPTDPDFQQRFVVENHVDRMQRWTVGGIAAGFLGRLHLADPRPEYLELARRYQAFSMRATDAQFGYPSVCKSSWGASLLYQVTGEDEYLSWLGRMAQWYLGQQTDEGFWHPWVEKCLGDVIEITLEFVVHMKTIIGAVASRPARGPRQG